MPTGPTTKTIKFRPWLVDEIKAGKKTVTWRLFDDKNLQAGDTVELMNWQTREVFATAKLKRVWEKPMKELSSQEMDGHESYPSAEEFYKTYATYYRQPIGPETVAKLIEFEILRWI